MAAVGRIHAQIIRKRTQRFFRLNLTEVSTRGKSKPRRISLLEHDQTKAWRAPTELQNNGVYPSQKLSTASKIGDRICYTHCPLTAILPRSLLRASYGVKRLERSRLTAQQKVNFLELMLGQIPNYCSIISRNTLVKNSTSNQSIWNTIRLHFGFQITGAHFIDFTWIPMKDLKIFTKG